VASEHLHQWQRGTLVGLPDPLEGGRLADPQSDEETDGHENDAEQERDPPSPAREGRVSKGTHGADGQGGQQQPDRHPELRPAAVPASPPLGSVLHTEEDRAAPLSTQTNALKHAQDEQEDRGGGPIW